MIDIRLLVNIINILNIYGLNIDIIRKILIEWKVWVENKNIMNRCFSQMFNPILLDNGGTRWDYRSDFYHRHFKKKKRANGKSGWKKRKWKWWHENPSRYAPYYNLLPKEERKKTNYIQYIYPLMIRSEMDEYGNVKCSYEIDGKGFNPHLIYDRKAAIFIINNKLSRYFDTSEMCDNADTEELISFIYDNMEMHKAFKHTHIE